MARKAILAGLAVFIRGRAQVISVGLVLMLALVAQMASNPCVLSYATLLCVHLGCAQVPEQAAGQG